VGKSREAIARMQRHYGGVFAVEMRVFFGGKVEVIANHFFSEILYIKRGNIQLLNGK